MIDAAWYQSQVREDVGDVGKNAVFELVFPVEATGGSFTTAVSGQSTSTLDRFATPATVQAAIEALTIVGAGNAIVSLGVIGYRVEFIGALAAQPVATMAADGSALTPAGIIEVSTIQNGQAPYFTDDKLADYWERRGNYLTEQGIASDMELQYLWTRLDVITTLKGFVWTQINQKTGDEQKDYADQYEHLDGMDQATQTAIENRQNGKQNANFAAAGQSSFGDLAHKTPSGRPFPPFGRFGWPRC